MATQTRYPIDYGSHGDWEDHLGSIPGLFDNDDGTYIQSGPDPAVETFVISPFSIPSGSTITNVIFHYRGLSDGVAAINLATVPSCGLDSENTPGFSFEDDDISVSLTVAQINSLTEVGLTTGAGDTIGAQVSEFNVKVTFTPPAHAVYKNPTGNGIYQDADISNLGNEYAGMSDDDIGTYFTFTDSGQVMTFTIDSGFLPSNAVISKAELWWKARNAGSSSTMKAYIIDLDTEGYVGSAFAPGTDVWEDGFIDIKANGYGTATLINKITEIGFSSDNPTIDVAELFLFVEYTLPVSGGFFGLMR